MSGFQNAEKKPTGKVDAVFTQLHVLQTCLKCGLRSKFEDVANVNVGGDDDDGGGGDGGDGDDDNGIDYDDNGVGDV